MHWEKKGSQCYHFRGVQQLYLKWHLYESGRLHSGGQSLTTKVFLITILKVKLDYFSWVNFDHQDYLYGHIWSLVDHLKVSGLTTKMVKHDQLVGPCYTSLLVYVTIKWVKMTTQVVLLTTMCLVDQYCHSSHGWKETNTWVVLDSSFIVVSKSHSNVADWLTDW